MNNSLSAGSGINRRQLLKFGLLGSLVLATTGGVAGLYHGFTRITPASGFIHLRDSDLPMLRRLVPVLLEGALPADNPTAAVEATLRGLDNSLHHLSPSMRKQSLQLFDLLSLHATRGPTTGIWGSWEEASTTDIQHFLQRWENSRLALLRQGHGALSKAVLLVWYSLPESWAQCGYPGPPRF